MIPERIVPRVEYTRVVFDEESLRAGAHIDAVARFLGEQREMRFVKPSGAAFFAHCSAGRDGAFFRSLFQVKPNSALIAKERLEDRAGA